MIHLVDYLFECSLDKEYELLYDGEAPILEGNEIMFPKNGKSGRCKIYIGNHGKERMQERNVSEREVLDAIFGAYKELSQKFKEGELKQSRDGQDSRFVIIDARKDQKNPVSVAAFIARSFKNDQLVHPNIIIRTVFKGGDFSGATRHSNSRKGKEEVKIFLY